MHTTVSEDEVAGAKKPPESKVMNNARDIPSAANFEQTECLDDAVGVGNNLLCGMVRFGHIVSASTPFNSWLVNVHHVVIVQHTSTRL